MTDIIITFFRLQKTLYRYSSIMSIFSLNCVLRIKCILHTLDFEWSSSIKIHTLSIIWTNAETSLLTGCWTTIWESKMLHRRVHVVVPQTFIFSPPKHCLIKLNSYKNKSTLFCNYYIFINVIASKMTLLKGLTWPVPHFDHIGKDILLDYWIFITFFVQIFITF